MRVLVLLITLLFSAPGRCDAHRAIGHIEFCLVPEPEPPRQPRHLNNNPCHDPFLQQLHNDVAQPTPLLRSLTSVDFCFGGQAQEYCRQGIDPIWALSAARNVFTRCTVINFRNGGMLARQVISPSRLPQDFVDDCSQISWFEHLFVKNRSPDEFMREFHGKLCNVQLEHSCASRAPYARAAMRQWNLYQYLNFCQFLQRFCIYDDYMLEIAAQVMHDQEFARHVTYACESAPAYIKQEAQRIENKRAHVAAETRRAQEEQAKIAGQQAALVEQKNVRDAYHAQEQDMLAEEQSWRDLYEMYELHVIGEQAHFAGRLQAVHDMHDAGVVYSDKAYQLDSDVSRLLTKNGCAVERYGHCYGNQLQQVLHQECINLLEHVTKWSPTQLYICSADSFVDCIDAAREYNQSGMVAKASQVADFCWAVIDYGKQIALQITPHAKAVAREALKYGSAVVEGGVQGILVAAQDLINHPAQTALCAVAGEYVLAYQLCKVLYNVLDLSITALVDSEKARTQWDEYLAPVNSVIDAINNKEVTLRDAVKAGTVLAVGWKAQSKILKGLHTCYSTARLKAVEYVKNNPLATPEQYMATPDGMLSKFSQETPKTKTPLKYRPILGSELTGDYEKYTEDAIEQGIKWVMKDDNKISHIFGRDNKHNFDSLVQVLGGREELLRAVLQQLNGRVPFAKVFKDVIVHVNKHEILVRGIIIDGIPNLGTIFIK